MPSAAEQEAIDVAKRTFIKWFRCQSGAAIISCFFLVVLQPIVLTPLSCIAVCGMSAFTCAAGYYTSRCKDNELDVMYQLYAFMVTALIFVLVQTVMLPCFKAFYDHSQAGFHLTDNYVIATFVSMVYGMISIKATTAVNTYGETVHPLKKKKA
mmetsp:Transcript_36013/g.121968  ORF Transcript_36013/g.121968 Transcript_36013/m.121968 type:complete len:154 (-) Transcript_36013:44-505(-)